MTEAGWMSRDAARAAADAYDGEMFLGWPDAWYDAQPVLYGCENGHVSTCLLKSERLGRMACLGCFGEVWRLPPLDALERLSARSPEPACDHADVAPGEGSGCDVRCKRCGAPHTKYGWGSPPELAQ